MKLIKYYHLLIFFGVGIFAFVLRLHHLDYESLFMDELAQVQFYGQKPIELIQLAATHMQPPLDYWVGNFFFLFSSSEFTARLPAALWGTMAVMLFVVLVARTSGLLSALAGGLIFSLLPYHIYFSQEVRPYSIAIFFLLALLLVLDIIYSNKSNSWKEYSLLFCVALFFMLTRALAPLLVVLHLILFSITVYVVEWTKGNQPKKIFTKHLNVALVLLVASLCYAPFFINILRGSQRYVKGEGTLSLQMILDGMHRFEPFYIWRAYAVQAEPLKWVLLFLAIVAIFNIIFYHRNNNVLIKRAVVFLSLSVPFSHLFIFQTKSEHLFRPPYAIYILPLALLLGVWAMGVVFEWHSRLRKGVASTASMLVLLLVIFIPLIAATADFKQQRIKSDWRGLCQYLEENFGHDTLFIFETLAPRHSWNPNFWGFPWYYKGSSKGMPLQDFAASIESINDVRLRPVIIFFRYRNNYLTSRSEYGIFPVGYPDAMLFSAMQLDPDLKLVEFQGFSVFSLQNKGDALKGEALTLFEKVLPLLPADSSATHMYLTGAVLSRSCGKTTQAETFLQQARKIARASQEQDVSIVGEYLSTIEPTDDCNIHN